MTAVFMTHLLEVFTMHPLPVNYHMRLFQDADDIKTWAEVVTAAGEFGSATEATERFNSEFSPHLSEVKKRMLFMETGAGEVIGTVTAWYGRYDGESLGRLHWVAIKPAYQGLSLGRPLITEGMRLLQEKHAAAYLKTQRESEAAIHLYKELGWRVC